MSSLDSSTEAQTLPRGSADLNARRILVIEDSPVVAPFTADLLADLGYKVIGPAPNMATARELADGDDYDAAILDIHIRGERVFPLCEVLAAKRIPFVLTSGYADWQIPEKWQDCPRLQKPYTMEQMGQALGALLAGRDD
jgi:CheY-like chemotaxis protein